MSSPDEKKDGQGPQTPERDGRSVEKMLEEVDEVCRRLQHEGRYLEALQFHVRALELRRERFSEESEEAESGLLNIAELNHRIAQDHLQLGNTREASQYLLAAESMTRRPMLHTLSNKRRLVVRAKMLSLYAVLKKQLGKAAVGVRYAEKAVTIMMKLGVSDELPLAILNLAALNSALGLHRDALQYSYMALQTTKDMLQSGLHNHEYHGRVSAADIEMDTGFVEDMEGSEAPHTATRNHEAKPLLVDPDVVPDFEPSSRPKDPAAEARAAYSMEERLVESLVDEEEAKLELDHLPHPFLRAVLDVFWEKNPKVVAPALYHVLEEVSFLGTADTMLMGVDAEDQSDAAALWSQLTKVTPSVAAALSAAKHHPMPMLEVHTRAYSNAALTPLENLALAALIAVPQEDDAPKQTSPQSAPQSHSPPAQPVPAAEPYQPPELADERKRALPTAEMNRLMLLRKVKVREARRQWCAKITKERVDYSRRAHFAALTLQCWIRMLLAQMGVRRRARPQHPIISTSAPHDTPSPSMAEVAGRQPLPAPVVHTPEPQPQPPPTPPRSPLKSPSTAPPSRSPSRRHDEPSSHSPLVTTEDVDLPSPSRRQSSAGSPAGSIGGLSEIYRGLEEEGEEGDGGDEGVGTEDEAPRGEDLCGPLLDDERAGGRVVTPQHPTAQRDVPVNELGGDLGPGGVLALCYHNIAVEQEHCEEYTQHLKSYRLAVSTSQEYLGLRHPLTRKLRRRLQEATAAHRLRTAQNHILLTTSRRRQQQRDLRHHAHVSASLHTRRAQQLPSTASTGPLWGASTLTSNTSVFRERTAPPRRQAATPSPRHGRRSRHKAQGRPLTTIRTVRERDERPPWHVGRQSQDDDLFELKKMQLQRKREAAMRLEAESVYAPKAGQAAGDVTECSAEESAVVPLPTLRVPKPRVKRKMPPLPQVGIVPVTSAVQRAHSPPRRAAPATGATTLTDSTAPSGKRVLKPNVMSSVKALTSVTKAHDAWIREALTEDWDDGLDKFNDADLAFLSSTFNLPLTKPVGIRSQKKGGPHEGRLDETQVAMRQQRAQAAAWLDELRQQPGNIY